MGEGHEVSQQRVVGPLHQPNRNAQLLGTICREKKGGKGRGRVRRGKMTTREGDGRGKGRREERGGIPKMG